MDTSARRPTKLAIAIAVVSLMSMPLGAQSSKGKWRTPWGDPDLQGSWSNATTTPLQRLAKFGTRQFLTAEEKAELDKQTRVGTDRRGSTPERDVAEAYNQFWWDRGLSDGRTSLIYDPLDGRIPPLTPEGRKRREAFQHTERFTEDGAGGGANSWLDRSLYERCVIRAPLPRTSTGYDNNYQIVQSPGYVAILQEQIHETRLVSLDGRPHLDKSVGQWLGDSRGHWEGDTLIVETTNFSNMTDFQGSGPNMRLVERWTRVADDRLDYKFTVADPTAWTKPWSAAITWSKVGLLYEYACHEGNYGLYDILEGARTKEAEEAAKKSK